MPQARKLQGWVTIRGPDGGTVVQDEDEWLDLLDHEDVAIWYQVTDASNVDTFAIQTSPVCEAEVFATMATLSTTTSSTPNLRVVTWAAAETPLARFIRWRCVGRAGGSFSITFRVWVVASERVRKSRRPMLWLPYDDASLGSSGETAMGWGAECGCSGNAEPGAALRHPTRRLLARAAPRGSAGTWWGRGPLMLPPADQQLYGGTGGGPDGGPGLGWGGKPLPLGIAFVDPCANVADELLAELAELEKELKSALENAQAELNCVNDDGSPCPGPGQKSLLAGEIISIQKQIHDKQTKIYKALLQCCLAHGGDPTGLFTSPAELQLILKATSKQGDITANIKFTGEQVANVVFHFYPCWHRMFEVTGFTIDNVDLNDLAHLEFHDIEMSGTFLGAHLGPPNGHMELTLSVLVKAFAAGFSKGENRITVTLSTGAHSDENNVDGEPLWEERDADNNVVLGYNAFLLMESVDIASESETEEGKGPFFDDDIQITHVSFRIKRLKDNPFITPT